MRTENRAASLTVLYDEAASEPIWRVEKITVGARPEHRLRAAAACATTYSTLTDAVRKWHESKLANPDTVTFYVCAREQVDRVKAPLSATAGRTIMMVTAVTAVTAIIAGRTRQAGAIVLQALLSINRQRRSCPSK